ncbi:hypothetical protein BKA58DRAFT_376002 [Alternaria rosae]|uniref:uncharacterized protein n=1 Tax=Alternaria rosae TaxID=1187941 RepID=UPI001E8DFEDB|nr:uncharacterized protein BKA58DRAFT_376002 [Alternaria rosae]KAH6877823.1 hypothetical protein BKA58DRAFT_376002 [Alternaria rosae]
MAGTGLQPVNIFLIIFPFLVSFSIVSIRIWRKIKKRTYAIEDTLLVVAEAILAVLTATMWKYTFGVFSTPLPSDSIQSSWCLTQDTIWPPRKYLPDAVCFRS